MYNASSATNLAKGEWFIHLLVLLRRMTGQREQDRGVTLVAPIWEVVHIKTLDLGIPYTIQFLTENFDESLFPP